MLLVPPKDGLPGGPAAHAPLARCIHASAAGVRRSRAESAPAARPTADFTGNAIAA